MKGLSEKCIDLLYCLFVLVGTLQSHSHFKVVAVVLQRFWETSYPFGPTAAQQSEGATTPTAVAEKNVEDVVDLALICPLCKHLCVEATVVSNGVLSLASCDHLFCETCIAQHVRTHELSCLRNVL